MGKEYLGELQLASKGHFYNIDWDGVLHVEPWGLEEESILMSPNVSFTEALDRLIPRLTDCPVKPPDLLLKDRFQIFLYMKCLSIGSDYTFFYPCENDMCGKKARHDMNLEKDLNVTYVDDPDFLESIGMDDVEQLTEPFDLILPNNHTIGWRMLRGKDERAVDKYVRRMQKGTTKKPAKKDHVYRAALRIETIDGEKPDNIREAMDFVINSMRGKNAVAFRQAIEEMRFGVDTELQDVECDHCGYPQDIEMPLDKEFFRPKKRIA